MEYLYLLCLLISIGMLVWLKLYDVRNSLTQYLNLILVIISNFGYYFMAISRSLDFFLVLEICHFDLSKFVKIILVLCQCIVYGFVCIIGRNEFKKKSVNRNNMIAMLVLMAVATGTYVIEKFLGLEFEIIPVAFDVLMMGALIPIYDSNIFTAYENKDIINEQLGKVGFLTFDKNRAYKGCNSFMEKIFPELLECRLGQIIDNSSEYLRLEF